MRRTIAAPRLEAELTQPGLQLGPGALAEVHGQPALAGARLWWAGQLPNILLLAQQDQQVDYHNQEHSSGALRDVKMEIKPFCLGQTDVHKYEQILTLILKDGQLNISHTSRIILYCHIYSLKTALHWYYIAHSEMRLISNIHSNLLVSFVIKIQSRLYLVKNDTNLM